MMKLVIDERVKHRLIGLAVILSIGAIFAPAMMKKSSQRLDGNVNVSVELPAKPTQPDIAMTEKKDLFESAKVAHVELPDLSEEQPIPTLAKAEPLSQMNESPDPQTKVQVEPSLVELKDSQEPVVAAPKLAVIKKVAKAALPQPKAKPKAVAKNAKLIKPQAKVRTRAVTISGYAVQLATFTKRSNADYLISKLRGKGYKATYNKVATSEGPVFKVLVGHVSRKEQAQHLRTQLANAVQIRGFIVTTGQG